MLGALVTLDKLEGDVWGDKGLGGRGRARSLDWTFPHIGRGMTGEVEMSMVAAGH